MIVLALSLVAGSAQAATPAGPPSMIVTPDQFADALTLCVDHLAKPTLAGDDLAAAGWPKAMSQASDGTAPSMVTYRHPQNMLMLTLFDEPTKPDRCSIMTPTGPTLSVVEATKRVTAFAGAKPRGGAWQTGTNVITQEPMGSSGVRIIFTKKAPQ